MQQNTPAGWYPDPQIPGQQRYWDGIQWTNHVAPLAPTGPVPPPHRPSNGPVTQPAGTPQTVAQQNWFLRHKVMSAVMAVIVLVVIGSAMSGGSDDNGAVANTASANSANDASGATNADATNKKPAKKPKPSLQDRFVKVVQKGVDEAEDSDNEIKIVQARRKRASAMCDTLPASQGVKGWTGTVDDVSTELGGDKGVLTVSLTDDIKVSTWNNSLSDIGSHTLIAPSGALFTKLGDLSDGDKVSFSGRFIKAPGKCIQEQSVMDENGMLTPTFSFKFDSFKKN